MYKIKTKLSRKLQLIDNLINCIHDIIFFVDYLQKIYSQYIQINTIQIHWKICLLQVNKFFISNQRASCIDIELQNIVFV